MLELTIVRQMSQSYQDKVYAAILSAQDFDIIAQILKWIPMETMKDFMLQNMHGIDESLARKIYFKSSSITDVLPSDIIQYILSFQPRLSNPSKYVNKQWCKLSLQNDKNYYSKFGEDDRFDTALGRCKAGDRIFLHKGYYMPKTYNFYSYFKSVSKEVNIIIPFRWRISDSHYY